jgi:UDP-N-acetylmuramoyl-tripeptide--D-alanyl-D-alanine ligase
MIERRESARGGEALYRADEAAAAVGGTLAGDGSAPVASVVADSRKAAAGALFVALPGEKTDGHDFIKAAFEAGASCAIARSDRRSSVEAALGRALGGGARGTAVVFVEDALAALQGLARDYRRRFPSLLRIGITGSSGKTTTKECAAAAIGRARAVVLNPGNLNSDIGLSLSMFSIGAGHEVGVFEMGMNRIGEMGELARVYEPDLALVTNVGTAHVGVVGSRRAIAEEKKMIFSLFDGRQRGLVWEDDDYNAFLKEGVRGEMGDFGPRSTSGFRGARDLGLDGYEIDWEGRAFRFPLPGPHNLLDAIAAMALASRAGAARDDVAEGLSSVKPLFGRSEIIRGDVTVVRDCYNANPDSVEAAVSLCDSVPWAGRRAYVLGSMLELGSESEAAHRRVGAAAGKSSAQALFFFGEEARPAFEEARLAGFRGLAVFESDFDALLKSVRAYVRPGDLVLVKGSRGMALERLADALAPASSAGAEGDHDAA